MKTPSFSHVLPAATVTIILLFSTTAVRAAPVPEDAVSPSFETVTKHLDLGGTMFAYADIDGDLDALASLLGELLRSDGAPPELAAIDLPKIFRTLGVSQASAIGLSSYRLKDRFHNKAFLHFPAPREGIFKAFGGDPGPFLSAKIAPADTDLIVEQDLDLKSLVGAIRNVADVLGAAEIIEEMDAGLESPLIGPVTAGELLSRGPSKITVVGKIDRDRRIALPEGSEVPEFDVVVAIDGIRWLFPKLKSLIPPDALGQLLAEGEGFESLTAPEDLPAPFAAYRPVLYVRDGEDRIYLATRKSYLDACLAAEGAIGENEDFKFATAGLPTEGNGFSYISPDISAEILHQLDSSEMAMGAAEMAILRLLGGELTADLEHGIAHVSANLPDGILWASHSISSHKASVMMGPITPLAITASFAVPVFNKTLVKAQEIRNTNSAKQLLLAAHLHASDNDGNFPGSLEELDADYFDPDANLDWANPEDQTFRPWVYFGDGLSNSSPATLLLLASPEAIDGSRTVGYCDGSVEIVPEERFLELKSAVEAHLRKGKIER